MQTVDNCYIHKRDWPRPGAEGLVHVQRIDYGWTVCGRIRTYQGSAYAS